VESAKNAPAADKKANFAERERKREKKARVYYYAYLIRSASSAGERSRRRGSRLFLFLRFRGGFLPHLFFTFFYVVTRKRKYAEEEKSVRPKSILCGEKKVTHTAKKKLFSRSVSRARALSPPICVPFQLACSEEALR